VLDALREETHDWRALKARFGNPPQLRKVLRGLERNGDVVRDHGGWYHLRDSGEEIEGVVERIGGELGVGGIALERGRSRVRCGDTVVARVVEGRARIVKVTAYSPEPVIGILRMRGRTPYVEALGPDYKGRVALVDPPQGSDGDTVAVRVLGEERRTLAGVMQSVVAHESAAGQAAESLLVAYQVPAEWPQDVTGESDALPKHVYGDRFHRREDLRERALVTIDGETARDFDDAVHAAAVGKGWRLTVAIADVGHYVKPGSALDREAWRRGTSVYLPDRVVPMLPESLSNHLCSLRPQEERLALACEMMVDGSGRVTGFRFFEAVIRSWQRLTYNQLAAYIDGGALEVEDEVRASLDALIGVFRGFGRSRVERGGLDFSSHEGALQLRAGRVVAITPVKRNDAHRLIEEAMIAANVCAARYLEDHHRLALYRVHERPSAEKASALQQAFALAGVAWRADDVTPQSIAAALASVGAARNRWIVEMAVLRCMTQADYRPDNEGHFGLALERYMHFTSPIRRYPDLVVHRAIKRALADKRGDIAPLEWLTACGMQTSMAERRAEEVSRGVDAWLKCDYLADRVGEHFAGVIAGVTEFGLFVELTGFFIQGLVHISALGNDYYHYRPAAQALVGDASGRSFRLGDSIEVRLAGVEPELGKLDLDLSGSTGRRGRRRNKRRRS
jgi:ribonuclease R